MPLHYSLLMSFLKGIQNWTQTLDVFWEVLSRAIYHFSHPPDCISVNTEQDAVDLLCPQCTLLGSMHFDSTAHQDLQVFFSGGRFTVSRFPAPSLYSCQQFFPRWWPAFAFSECSCCFFNLQKSFGWHPYLQNILTGPSFSPILYLQIWQKHFVVLYNYHERK